MKFSTLIIAALCSLFLMKSSAQQFPCDGKLYFFREDSGAVWLSYVDRYTTATPVVADVCKLTLTNQNALGGNPIDHFMYFTANPNQTLYRIDANCNTTIACTNIASTTQGCFDYLGRYWIISGSNLEAYDLTTCTVVKGPFPLSSTAGIDIVFSAADCHFYMGDATHVIQVDTNGVITRTTTTGFGGTGTFGGFAIGYDGNLYGIPNNTTPGELYGYNLSTFTSMGLVYSFQNGTATSCGCDMASFPCPSLKSDFAASPNNSCGAPSTIQFNNLSSGLVNAYEWDFGDGSTDTSTYNPSHIYSLPGTYTVKLVVKAVSNCLSIAPDSFSLPVQIFPSPAAAISGNTNVCSGQTTSLTATGGISYLWSTGDTTAVVSVVPITNTTYSVIATDANGCTAMNSATVNVNSGLVVSISGNTLACTGQSATLTASGGATYSWSTGDTTAAISVSPSANTTYTVIGTSVNGCSGSNSVMVTVLPGPIINITGNPNICAGRSASLTAEGGVAYLWSSGQSVAGISVSPSSDSSYTVTVTDSHGCMASSSVTVTVNPLPTVAITGNPTICMGQSTGLTASGTGTGFVWNSGQNTSSISVSPTTNTTYIVTTRATNGCRNTDTLTVAVNPLPVATISGNTTVCSGQSTSLTASGGTAYQWSAGDTTAPISVIPSSNTSYAVTVTDANGCTSTNSVTVTVNPLPLVTFAPTNSVCATDPAFALTGGSPSGGTYSGTGVSGNMFDPSIAGVGTYTLFYNYTDANGCSAADSTTITVNPTGTVTINSIPSICGTSSPITLTGNPAGGTFSGTGVVGNTFDPSLSGTGTFTITYTYSGGQCFANTTATTTVTVGTVPTDSITASPTISCQNNTIYNGYGPQSVTLIAISASNIVSYQWYLNGNLIPGDTTQSITVMTAGNYTVVVTDANGCQSLLNGASAFTLNVVDIRCGHNLDKVVLCHVPDCRYPNEVTLCIAPSAVPAHLQHHPCDCLGPCPNPHHRDAATGEIDENDIEMSIFPNPFTSQTTIEFTTPSGGYAQLEMYDTKGALVTMLYSGQTKGDTPYHVTVDGNGLAEGIYIAVLRTADGVMHQKMVVTK